MMSTCPGSLREFVIIRLKPEANNNLPYKNRLLQAAFFTLMLQAMHSHLPSRKYGLVSMGILSVHVLPEPNTWCRWVWVLW